MSPATGVAGLIFLMPAGRLIGRRCASSPLFLPMRRFELDELIAPRSFVGLCRWAAFIVGLGLALLLAALGTTALLLLVSAAAELS